MNKAINHYKAQGIDLSQILYKPEVPDYVDTYNTKKQDHGLDKVLDFKIVSKATRPFTGKIHNTWNLTSRIPTDL